MSSSAGLLEFFILEAGEYIESLDGLVAGATNTGPTPEDFTRQARALRGSATMVKLPTLADVAAGLERVGRGLGDGTVSWNPAVSGAVVAAIDDLKILVRAVRTWGTREDDLARERSSELDVLAPVRAPSGAPAGGVGYSYFASEASATGAGVNAVLASPADSEVLGSLLARVRRLRGVASLRDLPPLSEVLEAVERAVRPLEEGAASLGAPHRELLATAAALLVRVASDLSHDKRPELSGDDLDRFTSAAAALEEEPSEGEPVVPVAELFYADEGPHVVEAASSPPTTLSARFRVESVSVAEHLRRLVADARRAEDPAARDRLGRELRGSLRALRNLAHSFGEQDVVVFIDALSEPAGRLEMRALGVVETAAALMAERKTEPSILARTLTDLAARAAGAPTPAAAAPALKPPLPSTPVPAAPVAAAQQPISATPTGTELQAMLSTGIEGIRRLDKAPLGEAVPVVDDTVVPIQQLLYRGRAALDRALEVREAIRASQKSGEPRREDVDELLDLLELVAAE